MLVFAFNGQQVIDDVREWADKYAGTCADMQCVVVVDGVDAGCRNHCISVQLRGLSENSTFFNGTTMERTFLAYCKCYRRTKEKTSCAEKGGRDAMATMVALAALTDLVC
ncbi:Uncharacterized protein ACO02O_01300 [Dirofilaria immitis]